MRPLSAGARAHWPCGRRTEDPIRLPVRSGMGRPLGGWPIRFLAASGFRQFRRLVGRGTCCASIRPGEFPTKTGNGFGENFLELGSRDANESGLDFVPDIRGPALFVLCGGGPFTGVRGALVRPETGTEAIARWKQGSQ